MICSTKRCRNLSRDKTLKTSAMTQPPPAPPHPALKKFCLLGNDGGYSQFSRSPAACVGNKPTSQYFCTCWRPRGGVGQLNPQKGRYATVKSSGQHDGQPSSDHDTLPLQSPSPRRPERTVHKVEPPTVCHASRGSAMMVGGVVVVVFFFQRRSSENKKVTSHTQRDITKTELSGCLRAGAAALPKACRAASAVENQSGPFSLPFFLLFLSNFSRFFACFSFLFCF